MNDDPLAIETVSDTRIIEGGMNEPQGDVDNVASIGRQDDITIEAPLFDITFKKAKFGNIVVDANRGFLLSNICTAIADRLCIDIAESVIQIQNILCKDEDIADGTAKRPSQMVDQKTGEVLEEFGHGITDSNKEKVEQEWAKITINNQALSSVEKAFEEARPMARTGVQYAYVGAIAAERTGFKAGVPIFSPKEAVEFRRKNSVLYRRIVASVKRRRNGGAEIEAMHSGDYATALGA